MTEFILGLLTSAAIWATKEAWSRYGRHLLHNFSYSGARIEGRWQTSLGVDSYEEEVVLNRLGSKISGTITVTKSPTGRDHGKRYKFDGTTAQGFLIGSYRIDDDNSYDEGVLFLKVKDGARILDGFSLGYHDESNDIKSWKYIWRRR